MKAVILVGELEVGLSEGVSLTLESVVNLLVAYYHNVCCARGERVRYLLWL